MEEPYGEFVARTSHNTLSQYAPPKDFFLKKNPLKKIYFLVNRDLRNTTGLLSYPPSRPPTTVCRISIFDKICQISTSFPRRSCQLPKPALTFGR